MQRTACRIVVVALVLWIHDGLPRQASAQVPPTIQLSGLPAPPGAIDDLLKLGDVSFAFGPPETDSAPETDSTRATGPTLAGKTTYRINYDYRARSRWRVVNAAGRRRVVITVRYVSVVLNPSHLVWLRLRPSSSDFWQSRLMLHELDHVTISSDPRLAARFEKMLHDSKVIEQEIPAAVVVDASLVDRIVDEHVDEVFQRVSDMVDIRYTELDRVTQHGRKPLPKNSSLHELLGKGQPAN